MPKINNLTKLLTDDVDKACEKGEVGEVWANLAAQIAVVAAATAATTSVSAAANTATATVAKGIVTGAAKGSVSIFVKTVFAASVVFVAGATIINTLSPKNQHQVAIVETVQTQTPIPTKIAQLQETEVVLEETKEVVTPGIIQNQTTPQTIEETVKQTIEQTAPEPPLQTTPEPPLQTIPEPPLQTTPQTETLPQSQTAQIYLEPTATPLVQANVSTPTAIENVNENTVKETIVLTKQPLETITLKYELGAQITEQTFLQDVCVNLGNVYDQTQGTSESFNSQVDTTSVGEYELFANFGDIQVPVLLIISDTTAPEITYLTDKLTYPKDTVLTQALIISDANITINDNQTAQIDPTISHLEELDTSVKGPNFITLNATDSSGNNALQRVIIITIN